MLPGDNSFKKVRSLDLVRNAGAPRSIIVYTKRYTMIQD